jgi:hypothetical protein
MAGVRIEQDRGLRRHFIVTGPQACRQKDPGKRRETPGMGRRRFQPIAEGRRRVESIGVGPIGLRYSPPGVSPEGLVIELATRQLAKADPGAGRGRAVACAEVV